MRSPWGAFFLQCAAETSEETMQQNFEQNAEIAANDLTEQNQQTNAATKPPKKYFSVKDLATTGILAAISYVLYLLPHFLPIFKLPFFPPWLDLQISDLPALLGGFAINPLSAAMIVTVKCLLKLPFTSTSCVGELADLCVGLAFVLPASFTYKKMHNKKGAIVGMLIGTVCATIVAVIANRFVLIPFYAMVYGNGNAQAGMTVLVNAVSTLYKNATEDTFYNFYLWLAVVPFNLLRCFVSALVTFFVYKPLSKYLHWEVKNAK